MNDYIYSELIGPLVTSLYTEVVIIGLFFVGLGYVRRAISTPNVIRGGQFWRTILLLISVMLFSIYVVLTYNIDTSEKQLLNLSETSFLTPKFFFILQTPLELIMVGLCGVMFLIVGYEVFPHESDSEDEQLFRKSSKSRRTLSLLFGINSMWHFCCIIWWLLWIGSDRFSSSGVIIHSTFSLIHLVSLVAWRHITLNRRYVSHQNIYDWMGVVWFFLVICFVYVLRMSWYVNALMKTLGTGWYSG